VLESKLVRKDGTALDEAETAQVALDLIGIVRTHHIVDIWSNEVAQNRMRNAIDDYFFDVLRDQRGVALDVEILDTLELDLMKLARARFPG
jgi:type I restriction enzyme R subunit